MLGVDHRCVGFIINFLFHQVIFNTKFVFSLHIKICYTNKHLQLKRFRTIVGYNKRIDVQIYIVSGVLVYA